MERLHQEIHYAQQQQQTARLAPHDGRGRDTTFYFFFSVTRRLLQTLRRSAHQTASTIPARDGSADAVTPSPTQRFFFLTRGGFGPPARRASPTRAVHAQKRAPPALPLIYPLLY